MFQIYKIATFAAAPAFHGLLRSRLNKGKEDPQRIAERKGFASQPRPKGKLVWIHAASVGEAQAALIVIGKITARMPNCAILITTGTKTSAELMAQKLPNGAIHQYYPLDHPHWVERFLNHWQPDLCLWMESELWPNMLSGIKRRSIPAALVNAKLSPRSYGRWKRLKSLITPMLSTFHTILTQTDSDKGYYLNLGAAPDKVLTTDNLKYSADPLPYDEAALMDIQSAISSRPVWVYASTHDGEEALAYRAHQSLLEKLPDLLTIIVPRHPERRSQIQSALEALQGNAAEAAQNATPPLKIDFRGQNKKLPNQNTALYIADTLGELGLFYKLAPIACIGRSFSHDGGGGHNPIEAALHNCAVLYGKNIQNLQEIFDDMRAAQAALRLKEPSELAPALEALFTDPARLKTLQDKAHSFATAKAGVIDTVMNALEPLLNAVQD
ncbi:MAG: 3-deoxy-D-manno-octulosonic acid transferase [Alphaproteobacteria bacterium]